MPEPQPQVHPSSHNHAAVAMLVAGKVFGVVGLALGATDYRLLGGALLAFDGVLLLTAVVIATRSMKKGKSEEKDHKQMLRQMIREGTLDQYLRDLETDRPSGPLPS